MKTHRDASPRTFLWRRGRRWLSAMLAGVALFALTPTAPADIVQTIDQGDLSGAVTIDAEGQLTLTPQDGPAVTMPLADVHRLVLGNNLVIRSGDLLLLDVNAQENLSATASIKLRAGLHHIVLPYWQATGSRQLELSVSGPGMPGGEVPSTRFFCYRSADTTPEPSIGIDEHGFRLPEIALAQIDGDEMRRRLRYDYMVGDGAGRWDNMGAFSNMEFKRGGLAGGVNYRMAGQSEHFGLVFHGFIRIDDDGEYTFNLTADDGARLYFGQADQFNTALPPSVDAPEWSALTVHGTRISGKLNELTDTTLGFSIPINEERNLELTIELGQVAELWAAGTDVQDVDRSGEADLQDTAYIRDRNNPDNVLTVPGSLIGFDAEKLHFDYRGQVRHIDRGRVLGVVLNSPDRPRPQGLGYHQTIHLKTGQILPGQVTALDDQNVTFAISGATPEDGESTITLARSDVFMLRNELGRVLDMTAVEPTAVEDVPFFNHVIPYRTDAAFDGETIRLFDNIEYDHGFAVHALNRLHYRLDGQFVRFRAGVGLLKPDGQLGNVTARILGDGKVLWQQENITADSGKIDVDVDLTGVQRLILEVDFGQGQNVGDRAAWVNPQLIRDAVQ